MYADKLTDSMAQAIDETNRRREKQVEYNRERGVDPQPLRKKIADITDALLREGADTAELLGSGRGGRDGKKRSPTPNLRTDTGFAGLAAAGGNDLESIIADLNEQMLQAAGELKFELAARLRDEVSDLKKELRQMVAAGHLQ
jgi:excinuclease ABC subunit B